MGTVLGTAHPGTKRLQAPNDDRGRFGQHDFRDQLKATRRCLVVTGNGRQRASTLEGTLNWSYDLLDAEDQRVFRALGVFVDGFDIEAAAAVTTLTRTDAFDVVETLVAKSLVDRADHETAVRIQLLETVKAYAEDRLVDAGEAADIRNRHFDHFHRIATVHGRINAPELLLSGRLRPDRSNITAAYEWASANDQPVRAAELILCASGVFGLDLAWFEVIPLLRRSIERCAAIDTDLTERLKGDLAGNLVSVLDPGIQQAFAELSASPVAVVRAAGLSAVAFFTANRGADATHPIADAQHQIDILPIEDSGYIAVYPKSTLLMARAITAAQNSEYRGCLTLTEEILRRNRDFKSGLWIFNASLLASLCHILLGDPESGIRLIADLESYHIQSWQGDDVRAIAHLSLGDLDAAAREVRHFAERAATGRFIGETINGLILLAGLSLGEGDPDRAREMLSLIFVVRTPMGNIYADHLARRLGILDQHLERKLAPFGWTPEQRIAHTANQMTALRSEMSRRGWT